MQCGRVGGRHFFQENSPVVVRLWDYFFVIFPFFCIFAAMNQLQRSMLNVQRSAFNVNAAEHAKALGQLVVLGFDVAVFTPAPYQRHRL